MYVSINAAIWWYCKINNVVYLYLVPECRKPCLCKESSVCGNNNITYGSLCDLDNDACNNPTLVFQSVGHCGKKGRQMKGTTDRHTDREKDRKAERKKNRKTERLKDKMTKFELKQLKQ